MRTFHKDYLLYLLNDFPIKDTRFHPDLPHFWGNITPKSITGENTHQLGITKLLWWNQSNDGKKKNLPCSSSCWVSSVCVGMNNSSYRNIMFFKGRFQRVSVVVVKLTRRKLLAMNSRMTLTDSNTTLSFSLTLNCHWISISISSFLVLICLPLLVSFWMFFTRWLQYLNPVV